ncbi:FAD-linked oxidase C-terminal domain-containing protein [Paucibacter sp. R3-3]|uniref:FAD-linked oxidase C-terminal domain-containing protein n=1 Tax=Roseateles agri TaxID=3098619 RepID=A0ABU5DDR2_9BURK|nr:FAD-linked oxidase C-terminal domain-containing protein [Paucibacter sp. R3-3]MDY0744422.1 FAD-linked oxidase C-terminal domain-containing protein [Paucibacter sp. R3-3]
MPATPDASEELRRRLLAETGGEAFFDAAGRGRYATDASAYQLMPLGVFVPRNEDDVAAAIAICRDLKVPIAPRGAGTSEAGQALAAALVIDGSKHLNQILALDAAARTVTVQPGVLLDTLNAHLRPHGLWLPVDIDSSAQATLGGMAGNDAGGARTIGYGSMVHQVLSASAWLSSGELVDFGPVPSLAEGSRGAEIVARLRALVQAHEADIAAHWPKLPRRGGYNLDLFDCRNPRPYSPDRQPNLAHLLVGSEGTLAFLRTLTLRVQPLPAARVLGLIAFKTLAGALEMVQPIAANFAPTAIELLDRSMVEEPTALHTLLVELSGEDRVALKSQLAELEVLLGEMNHHKCLTPVIDDAAKAAVWARRRGALRTLERTQGTARPTAFIDDCSVPLSALPAYAEALGKVLERHGLGKPAWHGHVSLGMLRVRPLLDMRKPGSKGGAALMRKLAEEVSALVRKFGGSFSGEGGDGLARNEWIEWQFGPRLKDAFRAVKNELDPLFLFNPGKIVLPSKMDDPALLRYPPRGAPRAYKVIELKPALDWSAWEQGPESTGTGLASAIEACDGNGTCSSVAEARCPSYRLTLNEQHGVRGRANTLRLAQSGQLDGGLAGAAVHEALDLCVGCRACRSECPNGVDVARLKTEALAQRAAAQAQPSRRDALFAALPEAVHSGLRGWLARLRERSPLLARLGEKHLGLTARRPLPNWRKDSFWHSAAGPFDSLEATLAAAPMAAVLFVDTFNGSFETENALAAARVLKAAGYTLHVARKDGGHHCCGRTALAVGQVAQARERLTALLAALQPAAQAGVAIVGLEPACLLTLREEAPALGLGEPASAVAAQALLFEEFVAREAREGRFRLALRPAGAPLLLHGHCHTKAAGALPPVLDVLRLIPDAAPELVDTACCGMAGGFGHEAEHYETSMRMAEDRLLPALRARPEAIVVADGSSCRQQIVHGAQREALHVARLLERLIAA